MYNRWLCLLTMLLPGPDLHRVGPLAFWDFRYNVLPNTGEDQNKVLYERRTPGTVIQVLTLLCAIL